MVAKRLVSRIGTSSQVPRLIPGEMGYDTDTKVFRVGDDTSTPPGILTNKTESFDLSNLKELTLSPDVLDVLAKRGVDGWTPILATEPHGTRELLVVRDWVGGVGDKPEAPVYVTSTGFSPNPALATDVRGRKGADASGPVISFSIENGSLIMNVLNPDETMGPITGTIDDEGHLIIEYAPVNGSTIHTDLGKVLVRARGDYDNTTTYNRLDEVIYNQKLYRVRSDSEPITGVTPTNTDHWVVVYNYALTGKYTVQVDNIAGRNAYNNEVAGFSVLVSDTGNGRAAIYERVGATGNWTAPAYITPNVDTKTLIYSILGDVDQWLVRGPDGRLPYQQNEWIRGCGWHEGIPYGSINEYLSAIGGTFTRGSTATYYNSAGVMLTADPNELRLDHDPLTGEALGIRVEWAGTNLVAYSSDVTQGLWNLNNYSSTPDQPSFKLDEPAMLLSSIANVSGSVRYNNIPISSTMTSASVFAKKFTGPSTANQFGIRNNTQASTWKLINVDYDTLSITVTGGLQISTTEHQVQRLKDDWIQINFKNKDNVNPSDLIILYYINAGSVTPADQASYIFGAHARSGTTVIDSYIPTNGSPATRMAENLNLPLEHSNEYTFLFSARSAKGIDVGAAHPLFETTGDNTDKYIIQRGSNSSFGCHIRLNSVIVASVYMDGYLEDDTDITVAMSVKPGLLAASFNGEPAKINYYSGPLPTVTASRLHSWMGTVKRGVIWDKAYSPEELEVLSA